MSTSSKGRQSRIKCGECSECFGNYGQYRKHLSSQNFNIILEKKTFVNKCVFNDWKKQEKSSNSMYVKEASAKKLKGRLVEYLYCHRSYDPKRMNDEEKSKTKNGGSNKIGVACPSTMCVSYWESDGSVTVQFYKTHLFHECELHRMVLHKEDRVILAGKLSSGVPASHVLGEIRDNATTITERLHLLDRQDIHNIKRDYNITCPIQRHTVDAVSVQLWIDEMSEKENNPVLFYKTSGTEFDGFQTDDFILIIQTEFQKRMLRKFGQNIVCFDGTHSTNPYGLILYTLLVLDEFGHGMPVAFMFSDRKSENIFRLFFQTIASVVEIGPPKVFMSDGEETFYNAFKNVIGESKHLLCLWHIHKNWNENLSKINHSEKQIMVKTELLALSKEMDHDKFETGLETFIKKLSEDEDTIAFHKYFIQNYANKKAKWSLSYRIGVTTHTNMNLENFHKVLKYDYLESRRCIRIDKTIFALLTYLRDKKFERVIALIKNKPCKNDKEIKERHRKSKNVTVQPKEEHIWTAESSKGKKTYIIQQVKNEPCCWQLCNICLHMFICDCNDNTLNHQLCKHIHAASTLQNPTSSMNIFSTTNEPADLNVELDFFENGTDDTVRDSLQEEFNRKLDYLRVIGGESDYETLKTALGKIDSVITFMSTNSKQLPKKVDDGDKYKQVIQPQSYFPKKKSTQKRKNTDPLNYASNEHEDEIRSSLALGDMETINIRFRSDDHDHVTQEHGYVKNLE